jgi:hypothetical protein
VSNSPPQRPRRPAGGARSAGARAPSAQPGGSRGGPARQSVEQRSALPLLYLRGLPRWVPPVVLAALLVAGLAVRGWGGAVALCAIAGFLSWLAFLSWPRAATAGRAGRLAAVACVLALAAYQASR